MINAHFRPLAFALMLVGLAACGTSPPVHYYALSVPPGAAASGPARMLVEVLPIAVPERLNRAEMVLTGEGGHLDVRYGDQWAAPLSDEIGHIISEALWRTLHAADVYHAPVTAISGGPPQYRLALHIERFEAGPGLSVVVNGSWTVRRLPEGASATCRADVAGGLVALTPEVIAVALAQATARLADLVALSIGRLDRGSGAVCPEGS